MPNHRSDYFAYQCPCGVYLLWPVLGTCVCRHLTVSTTIANHLYTVNANKMPGKELLHMQFHSDSKGLNLFTFSAVI